MRAFEEFLQYKTRVPVRGAILLNEDMDSAVLVKGWKKNANWSFPRGKINKDEDDLECALREVYEETGFDIREAGLVPPPDEVKYIEMTMREHQMRLYVFRNVPMDTYFEPRTRKEISKIQWYKLADLPAFRKRGNNQQDKAAAASNANKFYMVAPFLVPLKKWVVQQKKKDALRARSLAPNILHGDVLTEDDTGALTEPPAESVSITPAIDTMEGATRELQRLLKVQPPTRGLQAGPPAGESHDKGGALLALLQRNTGSSEPLEAPAARITVPHTPQDLTYLNAPEPNTPHHHHPTQRMPPSNYAAPPPAFHVAPQPPPFFQQYQIAQAAQTSMSQVPPPFGLAAPHHHHNGSVPLMHPQPLPPQVQTALFNRNMFPSPGLPDGGHAGTGVVHSQVPYQPGEAKPPPPPLNNHTMSLLNVFKSEVSGQGEVKTTTASISQGQSFHAAGPPLPPQHAPGWPSHGQAPYSQPPGNTVAQQVPPVTGMVPPQVGFPAANQPLPTDKHKSTLLDMFRQQIPVSERKPETRQSISVESQRQTKLSPTQKPKGPPAFPYLSNAKAIEAAAEENGSPIVMNPEVHLPFGALSILSRPKGTEARPGAGSSSSRGADGPRSPGSESIATLKPNMASPREAPQYNHGMAQAKPAAPPPVPLHAQLPGLSNNSFGYAGIAPPQPPPFPGQGVLPRQQEANPEQKQKLLSLFGKPGSPPSGPAAQDKGKGREQAAMFERTNSGHLRSQPGVPGSITVDSGPPFPNAPRRESQTPISPADRNFLLGYLESFSSGAIR